MAKKESISSNVSAENTTNVQHFMPSEHPKSFIEFVGTSDGCTAEIIFPKDKSGKEKEPEIIILMNLSP
jgi:topoisomerase-4 subunit A